MRKRRRSRWFAK